MDNKDILWRSLWNISACYYTIERKQVFKDQFAEALKLMLKNEYKKGQNSVLESELAKMKEIRVKMEEV